MAIDESISIPDPAVYPRVSLSRWINESLPSCQEILTAHDVARLTRRRRWVLETLTLFGRFPRKHRFHGRRIGWRRRDVLLWLGTETLPGHDQPNDDNVGLEPLQRELQLRLPPCRRSRSHRSRCRSSRPKNREAPRVTFGQGASLLPDARSAFPDLRMSTSESTSETP
jgi:predicted DNA-binding transcriptional regulator AlpA